MDTIKNDSAVISLDLMFALILMIGSIFMAYELMPNISLEDRDWRIKQYMTATRVSDNLVQDGGDPGWEYNWISGNYQNVTKIGFAFIDVDGNMLKKILDKTKINDLMDSHIDDNTGLTWWEFPNLSISITDKKIINVTRVLGLERYNFYIQLYPVPVGLDNFNFTPIQNNLINHHINIYTASEIDRYVYIKEDSCQEGFLCYNNTIVHYRLILWVW